MAHAFADRRTMKSLSRSRRAPPPLPSALSGIASRALVAIAALSAIALTGCGSGDDPAPTPPGPETNARFPFPRNHFSSNCSYPSNASNDHARAAYAKWKADLVTRDGAGGFARVVRPDTPDGLPNSTVSEGIAYGMILAVMMDDQPLFDDLWRYAQLWATSTGLMSWYIDPTGTQACPGVDGGCGAATDSDEDMAWALVMADRQWGGKGALDEDYLAYAKRHIDAIWKNEVEPYAPYVLKPGDRWGGSNVTNPSYFAPAYYRLFAEVSGNANWLKVIDSSYDIIQKSLNDTNGNTNNGLVPAWCDARGTPRPPDPGDATHYQYDAARVPFRIGQDYCWYGEPRAKAYLDKISAFFAAQGADNIFDGYALDGTPQPEAAQEPSRSAVFVGSAGVGAMSSPDHRSFVTGTVDKVATLELLVRSRYYNESWTALSLLMMSGNLTELKP
jgi:endo-1,4-beta-D-glucanase Y